MFGMDRASLDVTFPVSMIPVLDVQYTLSAPIYRVSSFTISVDFSADALVKFTFHGIRPHRLTFTSRADNFNLTLSKF